MAATVNNEFVVPVVIQGAANKNIISYEFELRYDPLVIQPFENPIELAGSVSRGLFVVSNAETYSVLKIAAYGPMPLTTDGVLLKLRFRSIGTLGSVSPLTWERFMLNEGDSATVFTDGKVELRATAANQTSTEREITKSTRRRLQIGRH
jgi:hypothetical protein